MAGNVNISPTEYIDSHNGASTIHRSKISVSKQDCPSPHSLANKIGRLLWEFVWMVLFRPSPKIFLAWRRLLLRSFGAKIGKGVKIMPSAKIWAPWNLTMAEEACLSHCVDCYCVAPISIGAHATVSQYSFLCTATHDEQALHMKLMFEPITIGEGAWVAADVFIGPGVSIGEGAMIGARSSVFKDMPAWTICYGYPCQPIRPRTLKPEQNI